MAGKTISVLNPTAKATTGQREMAMRPPQLDGKVIGFLWNMKPNGDILLDRLAELLSQRFRLAQVLKRDKPLASSGAPGEVLNELSTKCDVIVNAIGDCGSCTSWVVHDSIELENRGVPTVSICSSEFATLGRAEAQALGMPSLAIVTVSHPVGGLKQEEVQQRANDAIDELVQMLVTPREKLSQLVKD